MKTVFVGILLKNSRGRAYLIHRSDSGARKIYRLAGRDYSPANGERVIVHGFKEGRKLYPVKLTCWPYPKRKRGEKRKVA